MSDISERDQHSRVLIVAFEGWSDAGAATTTALQHLADLMDADVLHAIGADGFVDYQVHRPKVGFDSNGRRVLDWPETRLFGRVEKPGEDQPALEDTIRRIDGSRADDIFLLAGVEPSRDWMGFAEEVVELVMSWQIDTVIFVGSLFSDAPHSRPILVSLSSEDANLRVKNGATRSSYEGPSGITTVLELALIELGVSVLNMWAQVPHYVHSAPSPKATLAILDKLEELLDVVIPRGELLEAANEWESNIDRIAASDEDMGRYIQALEEARDATSAPEATGDAIAYEFEKFLNFGMNRGRDGDRRGPASEFGGPQDPSDSSGTAERADSSDSSGNSESSDSAGASGSTDITGDSNIADTPSSPSSDSPNNESHKGDEGEQPREE